MVGPVNLELHLFGSSSKLRSLFISSFNFFKFKVIAEEAILSEDNHVRAGDLLIIFEKNGLQVGLSSPHWRGGAGVTTGPGF